MNYFFQCECGHKARVLPAQAGCSVRCVCGRDNVIPPLSRLSKEAPQSRCRSVPPQRMVSTPALCLIIVSAISIACLIVAAACDVYLLTAGAATRVAQPSIALANEEQIAIRIVWGIVMLLANGVILFGAIGMKRLQYYSLAKTAAVVAVVPCIGPCFIAGIPLGLFALITLNRTDVRNAFRS